MDLESLRSNGGLKLQDVEKMSNFFAIFGKRLLTEKFSKLFSESYHGDIYQRVVFKFRDIWR